MTTFELLHRGHLERREERSRQYLRVDNENLMDNCRIELVQNGLFFPAYRIFQPSILLEMLINEIAQRVFCPVSELVTQNGATIRAHDALWFQEAWSVTQEHTITAFTS